VFGAVQRQLLTASQAARWPATASPLQLAIKADALRECEGFGFI
jgi:hypothetical protein